jgi:hypothetical protein
MDLPPAADTGGDAGTTPTASSARGSVAARLRSPALRRLRWPVGIYLISRAVYLLIAVIDVHIRTSAAKPAHLWHALRQWDGVWYVRLAAHWYPHHVPPPNTVIDTHYSTLGFEPLYSMMMWLGAHVIAHLDPTHAYPYEKAGLIIALVSGGVATVLIGRLAERWWGPRAGKLSVLFICLFPGSIVFSMVYTEGLLLALVAGCLLALEDRRWLLAGVLAGFSTAVEPVAFAIIPACAVVAALELRREGWSAWRVLSAPLLAPVGGVAVGIYLWSWAGTPLAILTTQKRAWGEGGTPFLGLLKAVKTFGHELRIFRNFHHTPLDINLPVGVLGACVLVYALYVMWQIRGGAQARVVSAPFGGALDRVIGGAGEGVGSGVSIGAWVWTAGVAYLSLSSAQTPPNPRLLLCAFPATIALAVGQRSKRALWIVLGITAVLMVAMSIDTFVGNGLRP